VAEEQKNRGDQLRQRLEKLAHQWSQGKATLKQIVGLTQEELFSVASQGYLMFLQGKTQQAQVVFEGLVAVDPKNAYYYRALGAIYWRINKPQRALKQFTYAIRVAPHEISSYINRAEVYVAAQLFSEAKQDLHEALKRGQAHERALLNKAQAMLNMLPKSRES
jgi:predicted Zn-dependent protease